MKARCISALLAAFLTATAAAADSPFTWELPDNWKLEVKEKIGFHSFLIGAGEGVMMFSKWPAPTKPADIPKTVKELGDNLVKMAKTQDLGLRKEAVEVVDFKGELFQGSYVAFEMKEPEGSVQTMYMVHDGKGGIFNGQFTGNAAEWEKGLALLKKARAK